MQNIGTGTARIMNRKIVSNIAKRRDSKMQNVNC